MEDIFQAYDSIELKWIEYVVGFTGERQKEFFKKILPFIPSVLFLFGLFIATLQAKSIVQKMRHHRTKTATEKFLYWLKKKTKTSFALEKYVSDFPELVEKTRRILFSKNTEKDIKKLKKLWKKVL